jgi:DNA primase
MTSRISRETVDEIKARTDIVDVIGDFVQLKRSGQNYRALSPFSAERTPSFFVFPKNQNFKDFSSGKQGDAITFIMEYDGLSYTDALIYLARKYGITIAEEEQSEEATQAQNERESVFIAMGFARDFYVDQLWNHDEGKSIGLSYFRERGFSDEIIRDFELGYAPDRWDALYKEATARGFSADLLEKAGLIVRKDEKIYDRFRGRVMFPVHNATGKTIAFGARILKSAENQPKYLNSPETPVYQKSRVLYGLYQSRRAVRQNDNCYLVEGYTDVISLHQHGIQNVVAASGTSLTDSQVALVKRLSPNITVVFDGDEAGIRASLRGVDMILGQGMNVRVVALPEGEDPDSCARKMGAQGLSEYLREQEEDFIGFMIRFLHQGKKADPARSAETIGQVIRSISVIPDALKRALYIKETSQRLGLDEQVLYSELNKLHLSVSVPRHPAEIPGPEPVEVFPEKKDEKSVDTIAMQERETIRLLILYGFNEIEEEYHLVDHYLEELGDLKFTVPVYEEILQVFRDNVRKGQIIDSAYLIQHGSEAVRREVIGLLSTQYELSENWHRQFHIFVPTEQDVLSNSVYTNLLRLKFRKIKKLIALNLEELRHEQHPERQTELQKMNIELKKAEADFARPLGIVVS